MNQLLLANQASTSGRLPMVRARGLGSPRGFPCELELEIPGGCYWALCGPAGTGKSAYVRLLAGLDAPRRGELYVDGTELGTLGESERAAFRARAVSVVFPSGNLVAELTLEENLELPLLLAPVPRSERRQRAESALEMVGLYKLRHRKPVQVSVLDAQRAALARGLLSGANLIVADEPCRDLAPTDAARLLDLVRQLNHVFRKTIVLATRDAQAAGRADHVLWLDQRCAPHLRNYQVPSCPRARHVPAGFDAARAAGVCSA